MTYPRPAIDAELSTLLAGMPLMTTLDAETLAQVRQIPSPPVEPLLRGRPVEQREITAPALDGTPIALTAFIPEGAHQAPCVYWIHPGGMMMGDRYTNIDIPLDWLHECGAVVVTVDYRLAPEAGGTVPVTDAFQGLRWLATHGDELGIDPGRVVVAGASAGGGLAAGVTLLARDQGGPSIAAQVLICPMLDHRNDTISSLQHGGVPGVWTREMNEFGWRSLIGGAEEGEVPVYASPALATDLSGLPPTYLDAGTAEVFRDEDVAYASRIWAAGGHADLHVWAGGVHGFDALFPHARLSEAARRTRTGWLAALLADRAPTAPTAPAGAAS